MKTAVPQQLPGQFLFSAKAWRLAPRQWLISGSLYDLWRSLTLPALLGSTTLVLFNLVDTWYVSQLGDAELAAISFTFPVTFTLISLILGLGVGTSALIGHTLGRGDQPLARRLAADALLLVLLVIGLLAYLGWHWIDPVFTWLGADRYTLARIRDYMQIWFAGCPLLMVPMMANSVLRAFGDMRTPSLLMALGGLINAVFDPLLIFGLGPFPALGLRGAVLSSVISWLITALLICVLLVRRRILPWQPPRVSDMLRSWQRILPLALPACTTSLLAPLAMVVLFWTLGHSGPQAVAAFGVGSRLESIMVLLISALALSLPPLISQSLGAGQIERIRLVVRHSLFLVLICQALLWLLAVVLAGHIAYWFSDTWDIRLLIRQYIYLVALGFGAQGVVQLCVAVLNALHQPRLALRLSALRLFVILLPSVTLLGLAFDASGVFAGILLANLFSALLAWRMLRGVLAELPLEARS